EVALSACNHFALRTSHFALLSVSINQVSQPSEYRSFFLSPSGLRRRLVEPIGQPAERQRLQPHLAGTAQGREEQSFSAEERRLHAAHELDVVVDRRLQRDQATRVNAQCLPGPEVERVDQDRKSVV